MSSGPYAVDGCNSLYLLKDLLSNAGQTCVCANRILVQDGVYDAFMKRLAETAGAMKVADGFEPGAVIGPLIDMKAVEKVEAHIVDALKRGVKVVTGGKRAAQGGTCFDPTVAPLLRFMTDAEAISIANVTEARLATCFCTYDIGCHLAHRRGARIRHRGIPRNQNTFAMVRILLPPAESRVRR
jgi:acyl-CoA reductase-like NAD-dependent aldehyde dehydrogenase